MVEPYHKAARDGIVDLLKTATKRDTNRKDEDGMTPVHYASSCGNVEALRLLVGKGGDPDKPNYDGASAVHLAASCGQLNCLSFLTNFGCNIWALNNDGRTPLEDAAYHGRMECVRHLDGLIAIQMLRDKKGVEKQKLHAKREAIKRVKKQRKLQQERNKAYEKKVKNELKDKYDQLGNGNMGEEDDNLGKQSAISMTNGRSRTFSELAGGHGFDDNSDQWEAQNATSHVYSDTYSERSNLFKALKGKIHDTLQRKKPGNTLNPETKRPSLSQPNLIFKPGPMATSKSLDDLDVIKETSSQLQDGSESLVSDDSDCDNLSATSGHIIKKYDDKGNVSTEILYPSVSSKSNGSMKSHKSQNSQSSRKSSTSNDHDQESLQSAGFEEDNYSAETEVSDDMRAVVTFLSGLNLEQFSTSFLKESIDLNALMLCCDKDLQELGLPLGPRRKILEAVKRRKLAFKSPGLMTDSKI
ncbi:Usher syndrome type-1G protein homolog isoform X1 [Actinia tenebrosa]|uniref:Usher syndrome type-1G protein homolog isoform X1 n=1 Tax=Actinia tenebrosa TaxID=6105 RepID=A0A6P8IX07_ACTTE|nr:Usher syndrome type-1G protein homolog isoform X1 [Actinia tenebrosa]